MGQRLWRRLDGVSIGLMLVLSVAGLFFIGVATQDSGRYYVYHQILWIAAGMVTLLGVAAIPYPRWAQWAPYLYGGAVLLLAFVLVKGHTAYGAQRWINVGPFQLQPSEFSKFAVLLALAVNLDRRPDLRRWRDWVSPLALVALPMLLVIKQPDLGTSLVFLAILIGMLFMAGAPGWRMLLLFGGGFGLVVAWIYAHLTWHIYIPMHNYQLQRLLIFLHPDQAPLGAGFNEIQSRIAVGAGGLLGLGIGGHTSQLSFLPAASTDFIFAVVADQAGFVGAMGILLLYFLLIARGMHTAGLARDRLGRLLAAGVVSLIAFHVLESAG
ncbi:MAG: FtsW/RodA/SpoVE family cell cycle protein, partial [Firmicutes bacterium]|nr:FtsW/RodA/SpoVE family cell cycle protein [Bacillota bacterium]